MANVERAKAALVDLREILARRFNLYTYEGEATAALDELDAALDEPADEAKATKARAKSPVEPTT